MQNEKIKEIEVKAFKEPVKNKLNHAVISKQHTEVVIHIGLQKTGSTFLQEEIFPRLEGVNFIYRCPWQRGSLELISRPLDENKINIISSEGLGGDYFTPTYPDEARYLTIDNLKRLFPNAKIIVGVRNYETWVRSVYKQYAFMGTMTMDEWLKASDRNKFNIEPFIFFVKSMFPTFVYNQKVLLKDRTNVINDMCDFIGCPRLKTIPTGERNVSLSMSRINNIRSLNKFFGMDVNGLDEPRFPYSVIRYIINKMDERRMS